jgi:uncharacterized protein
MVKWTLIFIISCTLIFLLQITNVFDWENFAFTPALAIEKPWTFITSIFLHGSFEHLLVNMLVLFFLGSFLENAIGPKRFVFLFFLSGIVGSLGYVITTTDSTIPAVGASGAIYGVLGVLAVIAPLAMVYVWGIIPMPMIGVAVIWAITDFFGLFGSSGVAHGAHLGGLLVGMLYGFYLRMMVKRRFRRTLRQYYN